METNKITIDKSGQVCVPENVRMTAFEIAALFEVYVQTVNGGIKTILKTGIVKADISCPATISGNTILPTTFGLDMITTLAFRVHSPKSEIFREWVIRRITARLDPFPESLLLRLSKGYLAN